MRRTPVHRTGAPRGGWLALGLSLAVHALVFGLLYALPAGNLHADRPLPVETVVLVSEHDQDAEPAATALAQAAEPPAVPDVPPTTAVQPITLPDPLLAPAPEFSPAGPPTGAQPGGGQAGSGGGPGGPVFFQVAAQGGSVVYVIDRSVSMGLNDGLAAAKRELLASLDGLPESARFQVIYYNRCAEPVVGGHAELVPATAENKRLAALALAGVRAAGSTKHLEALGLALSLGPDVIFWVTDADDLTPEDVRAVTGWNQGRSAIHAIELSDRGRADPDGPLGLLARYNRGSYKVVAPAAGD
jgi:hypothetical protein